MRGGLPRVLLRRIQAMLAASRPRRLGRLLENLRVCDYLE